jgi:hypothetical protein
MAWLRGALQLNATNALLKLDSLSRCDAALRAISPRVAWLGLARLRIASRGPAAPRSASQRNGLTNGGFMNNGNGKQPNFKLTADTMTLIEALSQAEYGQIAPNAALSELIGRNVQTEARGVLNSALRCLERDYQMFFSCIRGEGWIRITESEHLATAPTAGRKKIRRAAARVRGSLSHLPNDKLSREEQTKKLEEMSYLGTLEEYTKDKKPQKVAEKVKANPNASKKALELFKKK